MLEYDMVASPDVARTVEVTEDTEVATPDVRMEGVTYSEVRFQRPFEAHPPPGEEWRLYVNRGDEITLLVDDALQSRIVLPTGSVVALSGMIKHRFTSSKVGGSPGAEQTWREQPLGLGWTSEPAGLVIGRIAKSRMAFLALFEPVIVLSSKAHEGLTRRIGAALDLVAEEQSRPSPEADAIVRRLSEIIALEIGRFRRLSGGVSARGTWGLAGDARLLRAVSAFYAAPHEKWSLERLAEVAGMSRTAFAVRYHQQIGSTPMKSLRLLRMQIASGMLAEPGGPIRVETMASAVGYASGTTFTRAFARESGVDANAATKGDTSPPPDSSHPQFGRRQDVND